MKEDCFCPQCGSYRLGNALVCENCGYKYNNKDSSENLNNSKNFPDADNAIRNVVWSVIKFSIFVGIPLYLVNMIKNNQYNVSLYSSEIATIIVIMSFFLIAMFWIFIIYCEVIIKKLNSLEKKKMNGK